MILLSSLAHFATAGLLYGLANWIGLVPWRRAADAHWTERARLLWPARVSAISNAFLLPFITFEIHWSLSPETARWWVSNGIAAFVGIMLAGYFFDREIFPRQDFSTWWRRAAILWTYQLGGLMPLIVAIVLMPETFGARMILIVAGYLVIHIAMLRGLMLKYLRWMKYMTPAEPRLRRIVDATAARLRVNVQAVWQMHSPLANAFAFSIKRELAFTSRLLEICNDEEVAAICAHELGHLNESKTMLAVRVLRSFRFSAFIFAIPLVSRFSVPGLLLPILVMILIDVSSRKLSQRMEKRADELAATEQANEGVYASALEKLYRENKIPAVNASNNYTHPHLYDRMLAAGITPDYPRPERPVKLTLAGWFCAVLLGILTVSIFGNF